MDTASALTLDQVQVFISIVESGSFSAAARKLHRAQSAISYAIANLERVLGVTLFDRSARTPMLTPAGLGLLADARAIATRVDSLEARAKALSTGIEPVVSIAVDMMVPIDPLARRLAEFARVFPHVSLLVHVETLGAVAQRVVDRVCGAGISGVLPRFPDELVARPMGRIEVAHVVAADHPLAREEQPIPLAIVHEHIQLVLTDRSTPTVGADSALRGRVWRVADLGTQHAFLRKGLGWGEMPIWLAHDDLQAGRLVRVEVAELPTTGGIPMFVVHRRSDPPGPAARWLLDGVLSSCAAHEGAY